MINRDRVLKLLRDLKEWESDFVECTKSLNNCNNDIKKILYHSIRAYFLDFHILCEDYISISLKDLNKYIDVVIKTSKIEKNENKILIEYTISDDLYKYSIEME